MALQLTSTLEADLQTLAAQAHSTVDQLAQRALEDFVAYRLDLNAAVQRGREDVAAGRTLSHEEVVERLDRLFATR